MFVYVNTLYYTVSLLLIVVLLLYLLVSTSMLHTLTILMCLIVYVGAMMILIGYICAISPNLIVRGTIPVVFPFLLSFVWFYFYDPKVWVISYVSSHSVSSFFYSSFGVWMFILIALMLFITLLIVTAQYLAPKGPFRSISL